MIRIEASSQRELAKADLIDKNAKPYNLPTEEMERLYFCNGEFKPPAPFQSCAKCGHNLVDEPAKNKYVVRDNKRVQLQWEKNSTTVANFLEGKGVSLKDKKGNPTANAPFVFVIARSCVPKSELILLISFSFDSVLVCLIRIYLSVLMSKRRIISILNVQKVYNQKRKRLQMRTT